MSTFSVLSWSPFAGPAAASPLPFVGTFAAGFLEFKGLFLVALRSSRLFHGAAPSSSCFHGLFPPLFLQARRRADFQASELFTFHPLVHWVFFLLLLFTVFLWSHLLTCHSGKAHAVHADLWDLLLQLSFGGSPLLLKGSLLSQPGQSMGVCLI